MFDEYDDEKERKELADAEFNKQMRIAFNDGYLQTKENE